MKTSVVVVSYRRRETLADVLSAWLRETPDVWLAECSPIGFEPPAGVRLVHFPWDPGNRARHAVALLTSGDLVIKADDDLLPLPGFLGDILDAHAAAPDAILGVIGRRFKGPRYYGDTEFFRSSAVKELTAVDFAGVCTASPRRFLAFDLRDCATPIEDLHWQCGAFPEAKKFVFPSLRYKNLPSSSSPDCLFKDGQARVVREGYYRALWEERYGKRGQ